MYCLNTHSTPILDFHCNKLNTHLEKCVFFLYASKSFGLILPEESSMAWERLLRGRGGASPAALSSVMLPLTLVRPATTTDLDARRPFARKSETLFMIMVPPPPVIPRLGSPSIDASAPIVRGATVPLLVLFIWSAEYLTEGKGSMRPLHEEDSID